MLSNHHETFLNIILLYLKQENINNNNENIELDEELYNKMVKSFRVRQAGKPKTYTHIIIIHFNCLKK